MSLSSLTTTRVEKATSAIEFAGEHPINKVDDGQNEYGGHTIFCNRRVGERIPERMAVSILISTVLVVPPGHGSQGYTSHTLRVLNQRGPVIKPTMPR